MRPRGILWLLGLLALSLSAFPAFPQQAYLVKDINPALGTPESGGFRAFATMGSNVYFGECVSDDPYSQSCALMRSDGTAAGTGAIAGPYGSIGGLVESTGMLFFGTGGAFRRSDGTTSGTELIKSFSAGGPIGLTLASGTFFFFADDGASGLELWKSDGTSAGTVLVKDINPGPSGSIHPYPPNSNYPVPIEVGGSVFFPADDGVSGTELWRSDGTAAGTTLVKDINPGPAGSEPYSPANASGTLFFQAEDGISGRELWRSDGTPAGTFMTRDIWPGPESSLPERVTPVGGAVFFTATEPATGQELWRSDGTAAGTALVEDISPGPSSSGPRNLTSMNGALMFYAYDGVYPGLWRSDGSAAGTTKIKEVSTDQFSSTLVVGGTLFFSGSDGASGYELWRSDGTGPGTSMVEDMNPGAAGSWPGVSIADTNGTLFLTADNGVYGRELWRSDGTAPGTWMIKDLWKGPGGSYPGWYASVNGTLLFSAYDETNGTELWRSDGSGPGTALVSDINPGTPSSSPFGIELNGVFFFNACDSPAPPGSPWGGDDCELWRSDGTAGGTARVKDINPGVASSYPDEMANLAGTLLFFADDGASGKELWRSDGTDAGTFLVKDIKPGANGSLGKGLTTVGGTVLFSADDGVHGQELWRTDGTAAGTALVMDISPGSASGLGFSSNTKPFVIVNGIVFFRANDGTHGFEPWLSDGTLAGTRMVKDIRPGAGDSTLLYGPLGASLEGTFYFGADDGVHALELWRSDGTETGTTLVKDIGVSGCSFSSCAGPKAIVVAGGALFFASDDGVHGAELWRSDGTAAGTVMVADINVGPGSSSPFSSGLASEVGGTLIFAADDGVHGSELWRSDGTAAGTLMVSDIRTGLFGSSPGAATRVGPFYYFNADNGVVGRELWALPLPGQLGVSANTLDFGDRRINTGPSQPMTLEIRNDGGADLTVTDVGLGGDASFVLGGWPPPDPVLAPGESFAVSVSFDPTTPGSKAGALTITSDDPWYPNEVVAVTGNGTTALVATDPDSISFGVVSVGATWDRTLALLNLGTAPLTVSALGISGLGSAQFALPSGPVPPFEVPAQGLASITVRCAPTAPGVHVATLNLDTDADNAPQDPSIPLSCTGAALLPAEAELAHGTGFVRDLASVGGAPDEDVYRIRQRPYASYEVVVDGTSGDIGTTSGPILERLGSDGATVVQSSTGTGSSRSLRWLNAGQGVMDAEYVRVKSALCQTDCGPEDVYRLRAWETTGFIPRFNNSAGQVTALVLQNLGDQPMNGRMAFWNASGVLLDVEPFVLSARASLVLNTSTIAALAGQSGTVSLAHDGSYGALAGKTVAVEPSTGFTFDTSLVPRPR